ncbi:Uu.00g011180.m01.CDS01 [Anthostomella pinea]|uniref:Uu.00g011180.m01.CDS01 n=1 Tax=Anthostomella pinea TaxID=933095 RepID=A0AAI8VXP2_9PEZI|nr:Uu.00g011180.m01.CDS01 [Anthostomella pinea]
MSSQQRSLQLSRSTYTMLPMIEQLQLQIGDSSAGYHLIGSDEVQIEKPEESGTSVSDAEIDDIERQMRQGEKKAALARWLRKLIVLLPSFLQPSQPSAEPRKLQRTAWLDGLRGLAALFVVWHHMSLIWFSWDIHNGWTGGPNDHLIQLPIIRLVVSGLPNVMVFFVISGYSLSCKPLSLLRQNRQLETHQALASSAFRRHPRLFIPAIFICLPSPIMAYMGLYESAEAMPGAAIAPMKPPRLDTLWHQFVNYGRAVMSLSDLFGATGIAWAYSDALWTLPIEWNSSLVIFGFLLALSRCSSRTRMVIGLGVAGYSWWYIHWGELLFIGGLLVADAQLSFQERAVHEGQQQSPSTWRWRRLSRSRIIRNLCALAAFLASLFVLSMPETGGADSIGFKTLAAMIPQHFNVGPKYFWLPLAAISLVFCIDNAPFLQPIFTARFPQYLGRISYAMYLVHQMILHSFGTKLGKTMVGFTGSETGVQYVSGIFLAAIVVWIGVIWTADLGWRFVDANAVSFCVWAYRKLCQRVGEI